METPQTGPLPPAPADAPLQIGWLGRVFDAYLLAFLADGLLTLVSSLPGFQAADRILAVPKFFCGLGSVLLAICVTLIVCSYRQTRWRPLVPALCVTFWKAFYFLPLPAYFAWEQVALTGALTQVLTGSAIALSLRRQTGNKAFLFPPESTAFARFSWMRTALTFAFKMLVLLPALCVFLVVCGRIFVRESSAGFVDVTLTGLFTEARTYEQDGRKIHLLPTVHIASPAFYDTLMAGLPEQSSVILPEGVTDEKGMLKAAIDYSLAADSVGLTAQPDLTVQRKNHAILRCDADISNFSPKTIAILNSLGRLLKHFKEQNQAEILTTIDELENGDPVALWNDILETRNQKVLEGIKVALPRYEHIAVPWGAAHMPGIERGLLAMKARKIDGKRVEVLKWKELRLLPEP
jgi:hypothetical protein